MTNQKNNHPALADPWAPGRIPLDGFLERHRFSPLFMALLMLVGCLVLFQLIGALGIVVLLVVQQVPAEQLSGNFEQMLAANVRELLVANSIGQVLGLALPVALLSWLHTSRPRSFLRLRRPSLELAGLALLGLVALTPIVQWLGAVNQSIPLPEWLEALEASQLQLIRKVLESDAGVMFNLLMLAVVPAFCEELLFRGYAQRQFERSLGVAGAIVISGVLFGLYHLRLSQVLPLAVLGLYLAYLVWRTGSLWPAVLVHFANNAFAVVLAEIATARSELSLSEIETMQMPWYIVGAGLISFALIIYVFQRTAPVMCRRRRVPSP